MKFVCTVKSRRTQKPEKKIEQISIYFAIFNMLLFNREINTKKYIFLEWRGANGNQAVCRLHGIICISKYDEVVAIYYNPPV